MRGIVKRFGEVTALAGVDFELARGEIHALLGENGAGKSTLMHLLAGQDQPDEGTIEVHGEPVRFRSARDAARRGIGMVHQHFTLVENFTVAENLALAAPDTPFVLPQRELAARSLRLAEELGWRLDPRAPVWQLPVGVQQRVEIVKVLAQDPEILIFDEPTAVLAPVELEELFSVLERLRAEGKSLVFISHKLKEVLRLCDRITVLRQGRNAGTLCAGEATPQGLARRMVGLAAEEVTAELVGAEEPAPAPGSRPPTTAGPVVLKVDGLYVRGERGLDAVAGVSFEVRAGEIFGIAGVDGNGQVELAEAIAGLRPVRAGTIQFFRPDGRSGPPLRSEVGFVPQDRKRTGLVAGLSVRDNLILELHREPEMTAGPFLRWGRLRERAARMRERFDIRAGSLDQPVETLSGGNQQKIVIARAVEKSPRLLVALNPTRGVDVGATAYVHRQLREQAERGAAIVLISTELDEVVSLASRVGVLFSGRLMGIVPPDTPREVLGLMMGGHPPRDPVGPVDE